eukprot:606677_1
MCKMVDVFQAVGQGMDHLFNLRIAACSKHVSVCLEDLPKKPKNSPIGNPSRVHFVKAFLDCMHALISEDPREIEEAFASLKRAEMIAEDNYASSNGGSGVMSWFRAKKQTAVEDMPVAISHWTFDTCVVLAHVHLFTACLLLRTGSYLRGGNRLRRSWNLFKKLKHDLDKGVVKSPPEGAVCDLLVGVGVFHFAVSLIPPSFAWLAEVIGFESDRELGIAELEKAQNMAGPLSPLALLMLLTVQVSFFENPEAAEPIYQQGIARFASCSMYHFLGGYTARRRGDLKEAKRRFQLAHDCASEIRQLQLMCLYELGWCSFMECKYEDSIAYYEEFLAEYKSPSYRAFAAYQLGTAYAMLDKNSDAAHVFEKVPKFVREHYSFDAFAKRMSKEFLTAGYLSDFQKLMTDASNHLDSSDFGACLEKLAAASPLILEEEEEQEAQSGDSSPYFSRKRGNSISNYIMYCRIIDHDVSERRAWFEYISGRAHRARGDMKVAQECFQAVINDKSNITRQLYLIPHSLTELSEIAIAGQRLDEAVILLRSARQYSGFDFDKHLNRRQIMNLDRIESLRHYG